MRTWKLLRQSLEDTLVTEDSEESFPNLRRTSLELASLGSPAAVIAYLGDEEADADSRNRVFARLVGAVQRRGDEAELAQAIVWLSLWPALEAVLKRALRQTPRAKDELTSEVGYALTVQLHEIDLEDVRRIAATLVLNVERHVTEAQLQTPEALEELPAEELLDAYTPSTAAQVIFDFPPGAPPHVRLAVMREELAREIGIDADLVIAVAVHGKWFSDAGSPLGFDPVTARNRYVRAIAVLRKCFLERLNNHHRNA